MEATTTTTKNKFSTMLYRKIPNKIACSLIYAFLEWTLISLLLLHSLFSLFLLKFSQYFGLKPPCFLCSRLDSHFLHTHNSKSSSLYSDVICEDHVAQISKLGYCSNHRKLAESQSLCLDCSPSLIDDHDDVKICSCCDVMINQRELMGSDLDPKLGYETLDNDDGDVILEGEKEPLLKHENESNKHNLCQDMLPQHLEFYIDHDDYRLIPVGVVNSVKVEKGEMSEDFELVLEGDELVPVSKNLPCIKEEEEEEDDDDDEEEGEEGEEKEEEMNPTEDLPRDQDQEENKIDERSLKLEPTLVEEKRVEDRENDEQVVGFQQEKGDNEDKEVEEKKLEVIEGDFVGILQVQEEEDKALISIEMTSSTPLEYQEEDTASVTHLKSDENDAERSEDVQEKILIQVMEEPCTPSKPETPTSIDNVVCEVSASSVHLPSVDEHDCKQIEGTEAVITESSLNVNVTLSHNNEVEEERIPDTPTSVESLHHLHKKLLLLGRRESATEESLDGSMISEHEGSGDGAVTMEKLKSELQGERKALRALYKELEEERNASAIAANQTMAMITRLQEEKATMQMEALQYQRMMEEQSEYDQEALQMMNELMVKREKEKQELEKELEVYRRKVIDYEEREKMRILCRRREGSMRSRNSSASCSYGGEESDGLSIDLNHEAKDQEEDTTSIPHSHDENGHQDTPADAVLSLQDSLASFEEERHAILEQLKVLEEKLFTLAEEEEEHIENMKPFEQFYEENGKDFEDGSYKLTSDANGGGENGFSHVNGKHHEERRINGSMQKRLLPLFDATELLESTNLNGKEDGIDCLELHKSPITKFELEKKRLAIEEEVDNVYERLQALEADREFLKHCIGSLRKGDKGLELLQEILHHLRDLKSVELQVMKNMDNCTSV